MHSTQVWNGKYVELYKETKQEIAKVMTFKDLLEYAWTHYALPEGRVREILKAKGYEKFCKEKWYEYIDVLYEHWPHLQSIRRRQWAKEEHERRSKVMCKEVKIICCPDCWHYEGPQEAIDDIYRRAAKEREKNIRRMMRWQINILQ